MSKQTMQQLTEHFKFSSRHGDVKASFSRCPILRRSRPWGLDLRRIGTADENLMLIRFYRKKFTLAKLIGDIFLQSAMKIISIITLISSFSINLLLILIIIYRYPHNHGYFPDIFKLILILTPILVLPEIKNNNRIATISSLMSSIGILFIFISNKTNVLIDYETWIMRGMPQWGCFM